MKYQPLLNKAKLQALILHVAQRSVHEPGFGKTKLNKLLWWSDFQAFARFGESITGAEYMHLPQGPVPRRMVPNLMEMEEGGLIEFDQRSVHGHTQERVVALADPDLSLFSEQELGLVNEMISLLWGRKAVGVSNLSHKKSAGWKLTEDKETIPYETVFVSSRKATAADRNWAKETAKRNNWL